MESSAAQAASSPGPQEQLAWTELQSPHSSAHSISHSSQQSSPHSSSRSAITVVTVEGGRFYTACSGGIVGMWDYGGMDRTHLSAFRSVDAMNAAAPIRGVISISARSDADAGMIVWNDSRMRVLKRSGSLHRELPTGDVYVMDQRHTKGHTQAITGCVVLDALSGSSKPLGSFLTCSLDGTVRQWDGQEESDVAGPIATCVLGKVASGGQRGLHADNILGMALLQRNTVALVFRDGRLHAYRLENKDGRVTLDSLWHATPLEPLDHIAFMGAIGDCVIVVADDQVHVLSARDGTLMHTHREHDRHIRGSCLTPTGSLVFGSVAKGQPSWLKQLALPGFAVTVIGKEFAKGITAVGCHPKDASQLIVGCQDGSVLASCRSRDLYLSDSTPQVVPLSIDSSNSPVIVPALTQGSSSATTPPTGITGIVASLRRLPPKRAGMSAVAEERARGLHVPAYNVDPLPYLERTVGVAEVELSQLPTNDAILESRKRKRGEPFEHYVPGPHRPDYGPGRGGDVGAPSQMQRIMQRLYAHGDVDEDGVGGAEEDEHGVEEAEPGPKAPAIIQSDSLPEEPVKPPRLPHVKTRRSNY